MLPRSLSAIVHSSASYPVVAPFPSGCALVLPRFFFVFFSLRAPAARTFTPPCSSTGAASLAMRSDFLLPESSMPKVRHRAFRSSRYQSPRISSMVASSHPTRASTS